MMDAAIAADNGVIPVVFLPHDLMWISERSL